MQTSAPVASTTPSPSASPATSTNASTSAVTPADLPGVGLAGVNVVGCRSAEPPVLLLHGSFSTAAGNFSTIAPALLAAGRCVYAIDYGAEGTAAVKDSAAQVAVFVHQVLVASGASRLDVVGYSQGGLVLRTALRLNGIADDVRVAVLLAPSFHGTTSPLARAIPGAICPACADQIAGSDLLRELDVGGDLDGTVRYAVLSTRYDAVVTPVSSQVPNGPSDRVQSLIVQQECPKALTDHLALPTSPGVPSWVLDALTADGRPSASALTCG